MKISAIVCAAGRGERAGFEKNKLLVPLAGEAVTAIEKTVGVLVRAGIDEIVVAVSESDEGEISALLAPFPVKIVRGGNTRTQSVKRALGAVTGEIVLVHDGARPFASVRLVCDCVEGVKKYGSAVCALPVTDTVARVENGAIADVPPRDTLFALQTPQGFYTEELKRAYALAGEKTYTDDSSLYAAYIGRPHIVAGESTNRKLTYAADFSAPKKTYCGVGIDTHAFGKAQDHIVLAGVKIPSDTGLIAHSDGDVLLHAVMDALLSAAGLRDIGHYFPDTDGKWKDADSRKMLSIVRREIEKRGFTPVNLSVAVQAQKPRLAAFVPAMCENLAADLGIPPSAVGITVGTNEGLGYVGEGKGITVTAYCSLEK